ncbi:hypothetical protein LTR62_004388 [Meristemomyces frigidus]|uniref:Mitochondrial inner membrane protease subunit n=1 Tax=Meristemomyces frigidus TaxID=1508187 RepID=A0AAN7TQV0_9PEZI|nr:hypothetical protein LTR62_004388 [Meristemomyces frigidus]
MSTAPNVIRRALNGAYTLTTLTLFVSGTAIFLIDNVAETTRIIGESMTPAISPDYNTTGASDGLLFNKWAPSLRNLNRGDIVLFHSPNDPEKVAVKRVIATEGDSIILDARRRPTRQRDGAELPETRAWDSMMGRVVMVPEGHIWVEGDNWRNSGDSNRYGPISKSLVQGKAVAVVWPPKRFGTRPWEGFRSRTKVTPGEIPRDGEGAGLINAIRNG